MKVPGEFRVATATHTGLVRGANEDDFLVIAPPDRRPLDLTVAVADGMGGVAGGAEASRTGLRGFAAGVLAQAGDAGLRELVARGFSTAWARVREQAQAMPALREMGTTMTVLAFRGAEVVLGHIGDSRAYRLRGGELQQLSQDHAVPDGGGRLLRCIGGGLTEEPADVVAFEVLAGDRFLVCSDGVWGTQSPERLLEALRLPLAVAAERLIEGALAAGGPDNATAVVVQRVEAAAAAAVEVALPVEEAPRLGGLSPRRAPRLRSPWWPWLLLAVAVLVLAAVVLTWVTGFDVVVWLRAFA